jgi:Coenzyme PQQ synthesis protein D (PqqD)
MTSIDRRPLDVRPLDVRPLDVRPLDVRPLDVAFRWRRADTALWRRTLDGVVVLPIDGRAPLALRGPAARIWELLAQPLTIEELLEAIAAIYAVERDAVAGEVGWAVGELADAGALCRL